MKIVNIFNDYRRSDPLPNPSPGTGERPDLRASVKHCGRRVWKRFLIISLLLHFALTLTGLCQKPSTIRIDSVEPPSWWSGMKWDSVQLMMYGENLTGITATTRSEEVQILGIARCDNPSYAFVTIRVDSNVAEGVYPIVLHKGDDSAVVKYSILKRVPRTGRYQGFSPADVMYLITPDRFADGDTTNNEVSGMLDHYNPDSLIGRHGGDLRGIIDHLDYLSDLGVTALWLNPVLENNTRISYHGYGLTNFYKVDPRFGTNELYRTLVEEAHRRGLKIIFDHVNNHIGITHPWIQNLPFTSWLNGSVEHHERNRHVKDIMADIHTDSALKANTTDGWFADYLADLNQRDPILKRYLIQNTLWWIEYTGLDGIREDTYSYSDPEFLSEWAKAVMNNYPSFNIVGEVWIHDPAYIAPYQRRSSLSPINTNLPAVTDFALFTAFMRVFGNDHAGIDVIHECLTKDFLYHDPSNLVTFLDNHDVTRIMSICKGNVKRTKLALTLLLTLRGIPEMLYGTELGMKGEGDHGLIRSNFPGGFPHDRRSAFTAAGRTAEESEMFTFLKTLLSARKKHPSLAQGTLIHFPPRNDVYIYFRILPEETTMVIANNGRSGQTVDLAPYKAHLGIAKKLVDLQTGKTYETDQNEQISIDPDSAMILEVRH